MPYEVATEQFSGPLHALLDLIEERKLSVNEISLSAVVEEFVRYARGLPALPREEAAAFLAVASTLVLVKSRSLLPGLELTRDEEESIHELESRLELLRAFRVLAKPFEAPRSPLLLRDAFAGFRFGFLPPPRLTAERLALVMRRVVESLPSVAALPEKVLGQILSIEERAREILARIGERLAGSLHTVVAGRDAAETIVGFLALLELVKQGLFDIQQAGNFGEIEIKKI